MGESFFFHLHYAQRTRKDRGCCLRAGQLPPSIPSLCSQGQRCHSSHGGMVPNYLPGWHFLLSVVHETSPTFVHVFISETFRRRTPEAIVHVKNARGCAPSFVVVDRQKQAKNLQEIIEQLSANKADRRELLELKQFMVSLNVSVTVLIICFRCQIRLKRYMNS